MEKIQKVCRKINCFDEILTSNLPSLGAIKKKFGNDFIQAYIEGWIVNLREFLNLGNGMNDLQTRETAMIIVDEFYNLNLADINFIFKNAKFGRYGQLYSRLDGQIIVSWFDEHFNKRCKAAAELSILESDKFKNDNFNRTSSKIKNDEIKTLIEKTKFK